MLLNPTKFLLLKYAQNSSLTKFSKTSSDSWQQRSHCSGSIPNLDECFQFATCLTNEASQIMLNSLKKDRNFKYKSHQRDLVTDMDIELEKFFKKQISQNYPEHKFIGEETFAEERKPCELTNAPTWILDPIDGTLNFVHGFPQTCISLAVLVNKNAQIAIIHNPILGRCYTARRSLGAYCNARRLRVSKIKNFSEALIIRELGSCASGGHNEVALANMKKLLPLIHGVRSMGSAALNMCYVAEGAAEVYMQCGQHIWDVAAGDLIVREAGGVVLDPSGDALDLMSRRMICACSKEMAKALTDVVTLVSPKYRDDELPVDET